MFPGQSTGPIAAGDLINSLQEIDSFDLDMASFPPSIYRVPFIVINTIMGQIAMKPPNRTPDNEERKRFDVNEHREPLTAAMSWFLPAFLFVMHTLNFAELYITLATAFPSLMSVTLLSILLPSPSLISPLAYRLHITPLFIIGTFLGSFGALLRLACYRHLGRYFTFELALRKEHKLITDGPYGYVRHPSYLGSVCCFTGLLACQFGGGSWWAEGGMWSIGLGRVIGPLWLLCVAFMLVSMVFVRVPKEDQVLKAEFQEQWVQWSKTTPYRLLPGIY